jgi:Leucine-rich repeat (LRR) protein
LCASNKVKRLQSSQHLLALFPTVSSNGFTGFIPEEIGSLGNLRYFFASANDFTPALIPALLAGLPNLEEIGLKSTRRIGRIPLFLGYMTELILLDLDDNELFGPLPSELGGFSKLEFLLLNRNELTGEIPAEFLSLTKLWIAFLDQNALTGSLAPICQLSTFQELACDLDGKELIAADCLGPVARLSAFAAQRVAMTLFKSATIF